MLRIGFELANLSQLEIQLIDQSRGLPGVAWSFGPHLGGSNPAKLGVKQRHQPLRRSCVTRPQFSHELGDLAVVHPLLLTIFNHSENFEEHVLNPLSFRPSEMKARST